MPISSHLASRRLIVLLAAMTAIDFMAVDLYAPAFPQLERDFQASAVSIQATLSIFLFGAAIGQLAIGPMLDSYGRRAPIIACLIFFLFGSAVCAAAPNLELFLFGRLLQSIGAAAATVAPRAVIADVYVSKDVAVRLSIIMQITMISPVISPLLGAVLLQYYGWRADFLLLGVLGAILLVAALRWLPETLPVEARTPMRPSSLFGDFAATMAHPRFAGLTLCIGFTAGMLFAFLGASSFALISGYGVSPITFGLIMAGISIGGIASGYLNIVLLKRFSESQLLQWALLLQFGAIALLAALFLWGMPHIAVFTALCAVALASMSLTFPNASALAMAATGTRAGIGSAALGVAQHLLGSSAGLLLVLTGANAQGMVLAMTLFGVPALLSAWMALRVGNRDEAAQT